MRRKRKVVTVANLKGGVNKTEEVKNVGTKLAERGYRVLAIDGDSDCCLTDSLFEQVTSGTLLDVLSTPGRGIEQSLMKYTRVPLNGCFHVIPGSLDIRKASKQFNKATHPDTVPRIYTQIMRWILDTFAADYEYILIDPSPDWNENTDVFLTASDEALIPIIPEPLAVKALKRIVKKIQDNNQDRVLAGLPGQTTIRAVMIAKILSDQHDLAEALAPRIEAAGLPLWRLGPDIGIPYSRAVLDATGQLLPVWAFAPNDPAAMAYIAIADQLEKVA